MTIEDTRASRSAAGQKGAAAWNAKRPTGRATLAARYAHLHGITLTEAAREFGVAIQSVSESWRRLYPGQSTARSQRSAASQIGHWPEDEVTL